MEKVLEYILMVILKKSKGDFIIMEITLKIYNGKEVEKEYKAETIDFSFSFFR